MRLFSPMYQVTIEEMWLLITYYYPCAIVNGLYFQGSIQTYNERALDSYASLTVVLLRGT